MTQTATPHTISSATPKGRWLLPLLLAGPLLNLASELIAPREPEGKSEAQEVDFLLANADRFTASWVVGLVAAAALATAYVLTAGRIDGRGRRIAAVAAVLGVLGAVGLAGHYASMLTTLDIALHDSSLSSAVAAAEEGRAAMATLPLVILGLNLAVVLVCVAAFRARLVPGWVIAVGALAFLADWSPTSWNTVMHAAFAATAFAFIALGLRARSAQG